MARQKTPNEEAAMDLDVRAHLLPTTMKSDSQTDESQKRALEGRRMVLRFVILALVMFPFRMWYALANHKGGVVGELCTQEPPLRPSAENKAVATELLEVYTASNFTDRAAEALAGAVRVRTEVFDTWGRVGQDERWKVFASFHSYLRTSFPKVHSTLQLTTVNTYALLYEWKGSDPSLKPILVMSHQDVVPVDSAGYPQWKQPPFSGAYKDGWIWGRGSYDDKSTLISALLSIETLLEQGFKPKRSVVLAFGFDEEARGDQGAGELAPYLLKNGPKDFAFIIDEGEGYDNSFGRPFAVPGISEKGFIDVRVDVATPGGHSSIPPRHTSIGYLALLIAHLEAHPRKPRLSRESPMYASVQCSAAHAPGLSQTFRDEVKRSGRSNKALSKVEKMLFAGEGGVALGHDIEALKSVLSTTQAVDIISGGVKSNVLPEHASAIVNHRISTDSSVSELEASFIKTIVPLAQKYDLDVNAFGRDVYLVPTDMGSNTTKSVGTITISDAWGNALNPAPVSPTDSAAWYLLSGTIRATWADGEGHGKEDIIVAPGMMGGNTDTRWYWALSRNIYRYAHHGSWHVMGGAHAINE
ncbi:hypothetical protein FRB99_005386, partial [Tulasnella sp. 403]